MYAIRAAFLSSNLLLKSTSVYFLRYALNICREIVAEIADGSLRDHSWGGRAVYRLRKNGHLSMGVRSMSARFRTKLHFRGQHRHRSQVPEST